MTAHRYGFLLLAAALLAGCVVVEHDYPLSWDPLSPAYPGASCADLAGSYADRGEAPRSPDHPSLTYGLFGQRSGWEKAERVDFSFPDDDTLLVTVWEGDRQLLARRLSSKAGDWICTDGRLLVRSRRWVASDLMTGRENVVIELADTGVYLVARVRETAYGTMFALVPIAGTATHWYRFARLMP